MRALLSSFGELSPHFSKGFPRKNAKLISQTRATLYLIEKCSASAEMAALTAAAVMATVIIEVKRSPIVTSLVSWLLDNLFFEQLSCCVLDCIAVSALEQPHHRILDDDLFCGDRHRRFDCHCAQ